MFERIVRPFQTGDILLTKRIVKSVAVATGEVAILSWGAAGTIPAGVQQKTAASPASSTVNFKVVRAQQTWTQTDPPVTENVDVDGITLKRVRGITFHTVNDVRPAPVNATVASGVTDIIAGLRRDIEASRVSSATYNTKWD